MLRTSLAFLRAPHRRSLVSRWGRSLSTDPQKALGLRTNALKEADAIFRSIDTNSDGVLQTEELIDLFAQLDRSATARGAPGEPG